ncbi:M20/M25/M40 family metallo-hydrolase [Aciduricibacillus chroicocephali]|uniref:M20/M25/M40 family metallo-hydrolase n=1 Tax=Aciduricibacillus chroicocephali TaxID=3054939 RepID=A0ABY9KW11_9BACI|nr:M20/M25/M40 family metallo-hydrolase [Bacillaceae bacterium 44XB]
MGSAMTETKQHIYDWIDQGQEKIIRFVQELVSVPSDNPPGDCREIAEFIERKLKEFGLDNTQKLEVDLSDAKVRGLASAQNIVSVHKFGQSNHPEIVLNAYGDTVPPGQGWTHDPYDGDIENGAIYGRGAALSKSDIAAYAFALIALKETVSDDLSGKVGLAITFDGESGGFLGPQWLLKQKFIEPDMAITSGFAHSILNAHSGCLQLRIEVNGQSAHAASQETAHDALEAMTAIMQAFYDYRKGLSNMKSAIRGIKSPTLAIGQIEGGTSANVIPDRCVITVDRRFIPGENGEEIEAELRDIAEKACEPYKGITLIVERILIADTFGPTSETTPLIQALGDNWKEVFKSDNLKIGGIPLYADSRFYSRYGIPTVMYGAGPRTIEEANGYRADEHVQIDDLIRATKVIASTLYDLLSNSK